MKKSYILMGLALLVCGISWTLASPIGSASDDNFHLASTWCSHGIRRGICEESVLSGYVRVPVPVANAGICYLGDAEKSALCTNLELAEYPSQLTPTDRVAAAGIVNGQQSFFYWINGFLVHNDVETSVLLMRLLNVLLLIALLTIAWHSRSPRDNFRLQIMLLSISLPVYLWTISSNNSSSWTFLGTSMAWYFFDTLLLNFSQRQKRFALIGLLVSIVLATGSRVESAPFLLMQFAAFFALRYQRQNKVTASNWTRIFVLLLTLVLSLLFYLSGIWGMFSDAFSYVNDDTPILRPETWVWLYNLQAIPSLYFWLISAIGVLGSADFELYQTVGITMLAVLTLILSAGLRNAPKKAQVIVLILIATAISFPLAILQSNKLLVGEELVPRYVFPMFILLIAFCVFQGQETMILGRNQSLLIALALSLVHLIVLRQVLLRHIFGIEQFGRFNLDHYPEWWWTLRILPSPMFVWLFGSLAFSYLAFATFVSASKVDGNSQLATMA